jgi:hypothetical protein
MLEVAVGEPIRFTSADSAAEITARLEQEVGRLMAREEVAEVVCT